MPAAKRSEPKGFELVEARHIDALTTAVRALNTTITKTEIDRARDEKARLAREERQLAALEKIAAYTENLPALMAALARNSNGHGKTDDSVEAG